MAAYWIEAKAKLEYLISKFDIPSKFRSRIWMRWSGGEELKGEKDADYFKSLQSQLLKKKSGSKLNWTYQGLVQNTIILITTNLQEENSCGKYYTHMRNVTQN